MPRLATRGRPAGTAARRPRPGAGGEGGGAHAGGGEGPGGGGSGEGPAEAGEGPAGRGAGAAAGGGSAGPGGGGGGPRRLHPAAGGERGELQADLVAARWRRRPEDLEGLYRRAEARAGVAEAGQLAARLAAAEKGGEGRRLAEAELAAARDQLAAQGKESREVQAKLNQVRSRCCLY